MRGEYRKSDPTISTSIRFYFFLLSPSERHDHVKFRRSSLQIPLWTSVLFFIQLLHIRHLALCQLSLDKPDTVRALDPANNRIPNLTRRHVLLKLVTYSSHSLLNTRNMPLSKLDTGHIQDFAENREIASH